jgi:adenosylmethionine-8-amino-7-oxononanoate aminotransferase
MTYMYPFKNYSPDVPKVVAGEGIYLIDEKGKRYIDSTCGPMTTALGHCHPAIIEVVREQVGRLHFAYRHHFRCDEPEALAETLIELSADNKAFAFFLNGGSEASEAAYRIALEFFAKQGKPNKTLALGRTVTNHGNTIGSLTYGDDKARKQGLLGRVIDIAVSDMKLPPCYCFQCPFDKAPDSCKLECVDRSFEIIDEIGSDRIACVFLEPVTGSSGGALVPHERYIKEVRKGLQERDILLVADEIVTGLGRTGHWFNMSHWEAESDITVIGKSLGAGFTPISGLLISREIGETLADSAVPHFVGHTYSGNPLSTGVARAVIKVIDEEIGMAEIGAKGVYFGDLLRQQLLDTGFVVDVRGQGLLWAVETELSRNRSDAFIKAGHRLGVNLYPCRSSGAGGEALTFLFSPPLTITRDELSDMVSMVKQAFVEMA